MAYYSIYRLYWTPAPPKMNLAPATIKSQLYPDYQGASVLQESLGTELRTMTAGLDSDDNEETEADLDSEDLRARNRCWQVYGLIIRSYLLREPKYKIINLFYWRKSTALLESAALQLSFE